MKATIIVGDVLQGMAELPDQSVQCCVTSPPYWGLRDYGCDGQMGLESTPEKYVAGMVSVFAEVRRVMRDDGTLWLNIGDSYAGSRTGDVGHHSTLQGGKQNQEAALRGAKARTVSRRRDNAEIPRSDRLIDGIKPKDLVGIPWMLAFALRADGWWLRQDIIWSKPNPMPESVTDRCTKAHEYIFLMTKSQRYYYDQEAIKEPCTDESIERRGRDDYREKPGWSDAYMGSPPRGLAGNGRGGRNASGVSRSGNKERKPASARGVPVDTGGSTNGAVAGSVPWEGSNRNKRSVWEIGTQPYPEAHFATYPEALVEPCILAGSKPQDTILDPFCGSGTTGAVALRYHREFIGIELNPEYAALAEKRIDSEAPMFNKVEVVSK